MTAHLPSPDLERLLADMSPHRDPDRAARALRQAQDDVVRSCRDAPPARFVLVTTTHLLIAARKLDPTAEPAGPLSVVQLWLSGYDYELIATADQRAAVMAAVDEVFAAPPATHRASAGSTAAVLDDDAISAVKTWVSEHTRSRATGASLTAVQEDSLMGQHPCSYVGCSITAIGFGDVERNETLCDVIAGALAEANVRSYLPIRVDTPRRGSQWSDRPDSRLVDEVQVASSSLTVILLSKSAAGLGALAEMSARYHVPILVVTDNDQVSPMITGLTDLVTIVPLRGDLTETIREYTRRRWPQLVAHARTLRNNTKRWQREIDDFLARLGRLSDDALHVVEDVRLSRSRFHSLVSHPALWGGATHDEMTQLRSLLTGEPRKLRREHMRALLLAELECGWSQAVTERLERVGAAAMAVEVAQRVTAEQPAYWIDLYERGC